MPRAQPARSATVAAICLGFWSAPALAGSGPWVIGEGNTSIYIGSEFQRFSKLATRDGKGAKSEIDVDDGVEGIGLRVIASHGLRESIEMELEVPWQRVEANRPGGAVCGLLGPDTCRTTTGIGVLSGRVKGLVVDELKGSPVSVSIAGDVRLGQLTSDDRSRVTNLGEGTTDLGGGLAVGRSGGLGDGFWSAYLDTRARYRFSNVVDASPPVPGWEMQIDAEAFLGTQAWWSIGPSVSWFKRPDGVDVEDLLSTPRLATDIDRFARLRAESLRAGAKLLLRSSERTTFVTGAAWTLRAVNNPSDVFTFTVGLTVHPRSRSNQEA